MVSSTEGEDKIMGYSQDSGLVNWMLVPHTLRDTGGRFEKENIFGWRSIEFEAQVGRVGGDVQEKLTGERNSSFSN